MRYGDGGESPGDGMRPWEKVEVFDACGLEGAKRESAVLERFAALSPGAAVAVCTDADPAGLLHRLQAAAPNVLDWWPLEQGPPRWRIHMGRAEWDGAQPRTLHDLLTCDHVRIDRVFGRLYQPLEDGDIARARAEFGALRLGLERHGRAEEELLLPLIAERGTDRERKDAARSQEEHDRLLEYIAEAAVALEGDGPDAVAAARRAVTSIESVLKGHDRNRERFVYPAADRVTSADERTHLLQQIQAL